MNIQVKHNGDFISQYVISYEREHKICTAIGTVTIVISDNIATTFNPWDEIDIYEEGDFKVRYYVSSVNWSVPNSTVTLDCQDESKRLVDYFISDQYTIEYPTYTRFWIEKFLDEVGTSYNFETTSQGNLLSNFTSLGMMSAYEQILVLLQLSGWYMYFDGNGVAQIGKLSTNLSDYSDSLQKTDILDINVKKDDRMLRNRALVWGNFNPITLTRIFADVEVHTPWNYDHDDIRTMVIANSNIPNNSSAYGIANLLVKEFARITVEKHITATGARDIQLGDVVKVYSNVYTGSGLVTTFGVSMSKDGLITNLILDERCPRLFGYFNFGDYVYVGTFGDGVWRKHLKFIHTWENFSTGLDDLRVTDLHINNGIFSSVTSSGGMFYKVFDDVPWSQVPHPEFLLSSQLDELDAGSGLVLIPFSGIKARATMIDKNLNRIIYGLDTYSGENLGDYYLELSGMMAGSGLFGSGFVVNSGMMTDSRGWVIGYTPGRGTYETFPISVSGEYNIRVLDVENDGKNDYVSVKILSSEYQGVISNFHYGEHLTQPFGASKDNKEILATPLNVSIINSNDFAVDRHNPSVASDSSFIAIDRSDYKGTVTVSKAGLLQRALITRTEDEDGISTINTFTQTKTSSITTPVLGISEGALPDTFRIFYMRVNGSGNYEFYYRLWNVVADTLDAEVNIVNYSTTNLSAITVTNVDVNGIIYVLIMSVDNPNTVGGSHIFPSTLLVGLVQINKLGPTGSQVDLLTFTTSLFATGDYYYFSSNPSLGSTLDPFFKIFQDGNTVKIIGKAMTEAHDNSSNDSYQEYLFAGHPGVIQYDMVYDDTVRWHYENSNLTFGIISDTQGYIGQYDQSGGGDGFIYDGTVLKQFTGTSLPDHLNYANIYPIIGGGAYYIQNGTGTSLFLVSKAAYNVVGEIIPPAGYELNKPYSTIRDSGVIYMSMKDDNNDRCLVPYNFGSFDVNERIINSQFTSTSRGVHFGGFFISEPPNFGVANPSMDVLYVDMYPATSGGASFLVLQRDGEEFHVVQEASYPIRIDISNFSPLLTLQHKEATFNSYSIYDKEVFQTTISPTFSGLLVDVPDYRYTMIPGSGELGISKQAVYIREADIWAFDALTFSGVRLAYTNITESGWLNRIETSNFVGSGQYLFVTTSGDLPQFYQKDPELEYFTLYSGLPDSRATIIRLDDRI